MNTIDAAVLDPISHDEAMALQDAELARTLQALRSLEPGDWGAATDCPDWDVRAMYLHVLGACEAGASMRENVSQLRKARKYRKLNGGPLEAALSAVQISDRVGIQPDELVARLSAVAPRTIRGRSRTPSVVRNHAKLSIDGPVHETWTMGYLIDTIYLRDIWMHRVDLSRATERELSLTSEHDGRIVADVVGEWARRHGQPFVLELTGAAGGAFAQAGDKPGAARLEMDAVEFCRTLAGRRSANGLMSTVVPF
ncbi:MAG: maleylpyruvate isomerase family mycothiol-dependent enzyme [Acidimicrobiales bacterium]